MVGVTFFGGVDLASIAIWAFWIFFALLIFYIQTENMREGFPLEDDDGNAYKSLSGLPLPNDKTFVLRDGRGTLTVPSGARGDRDDIAVARAAGSEGFPMVPTGDAMVDGVGPASWAPRKDEAELDAHGHPKITPMSGHADFSVSAGRDPRGLPVLSRDDQVVGHVTDMWIDASEHEVRYLEYSLEAEHGSGTRLVPITMAKIKERWVKVRSLNSGHFDGVPTTASNQQVTKLEEEKICGWYAGGTLYS